MDSKDKKILADEIRMTDSIPHEMQTESLIAQEYMKYIGELRNEFQLLWNQVEHSQITEADIDLMCKETLLENMRTRRSNLFWIFSGNTKRNMTKNRLRNLFFTMVEAYLQGKPNASSAVELWLTDSVG